MQVLNNSCTAVSGGCSFREGPEGRRQAGNKVWSLSSVAEHPGPPGAESARLGVNGLEGRWTLTGRVTTGESVNLCLS